MAAFTPNETVAVNRIPEYNSNAFNSTTNPRGFGNGGHVTNFPLALVDSGVTMANATLRFANEAQAAASAAAADFTATSTSSVTIGTGLKTFTIQTGKAFTPGNRVRVSDAANVDTNYMLGTVDSYNSGTGQFVVNVSDPFGSGTISNWTVVTQNGISSVVEDTTPQLAGNLDAQENAIVDSVLSLNNIGQTANNVAMDLAAYNAFKLEPTGDITITFTNVPATDNGVLWIAEMKGAGDHTLTWTNVVWSGGSEPNWATGTDSNLVGFYTSTGGAQVAGFLIGQEFAL